MKTEHWQRVEELYFAALERDENEHATFLASACGGDDALRREVESLLALRTSAEDFIEEPAIQIAAKALAGGGALPEAQEDALDPDAETAVLQVPPVIGPYHLLEKLGEGGMGEVWLAEQREPVRRRVALKVVKAGMNTRAVIARFNSERRALALMDHPAIAKVFDAGSTPQGAPYFVMEYVAGMPITAYCDSHALTIRARLELFIQVCEGVQHAHQKAVIHRDLKPSNILVTEVDGRSAPKIIDFGVAKALTQKLTENTMFTRLGTLVGTPEYMSPEQALSSGEDIDTRTDVYSLGIILYELLSGAAPIDLRRLPFVEFLRRLREQEPPKPSGRVRVCDPASLSELAGKRHTEPRALVKQLRGDLDSIALKALEKDRSRRYSAPSDLAADIQRFLRHEAVLAVPPSAAYRARKFARRYQTAMITTAAFVMVLILAAIVSVREGLRANREAAVAQAVNDFLQNDLLAQASTVTQSGARSTPDPDLRVRTALDRAAVRITGRFDTQPEVEAAIRDTIGQSYMDLGLYKEARAQLERALQLDRRLLGTENRDTLKTMSRLGYAAYLQGQYADAEALLSQTVKAQRLALGSDALDTVKSMSNLGNVYWSEGKYAEAEALNSQTLEVRRRVLGPEHPDTLSSMNNLANVYHAEGKYDQAEVLHSKKLEISRRILGPEHPNTLNSMNNLANIYQDEGKYAEAETLHSQTLEIRRRVLGPEHPLTLTSADNVADAYQAEGKYAEAETLRGQVLEIRHRVLGPDDPYTLGSMRNLAKTYKDEGKYAQAEALQRQTLEMLRRAFGSENPTTLESMSDLALVFTAEGRYADAEMLLKEALEILNRVEGKERPQTLLALSQVAFLYQVQGKYELAETYASQTLAGQRHTLGSEHKDTVISAADLALAYVSQGKFAESEPLAREAVEFDRQKQPDHWQRFRAESLLGASLAGQRKYEEAEPLLLDGYRGMLALKSRIGVPDRYHLDRCHEWIVQLYQAWGKPTQAAEWRKK